MVGVTCQISSRHASAHTCGSAGRSGSGGPAPVAARSGARWGPATRAPRVIRVQPLGRCLRCSSRSTLLLTLRKNKTGDQLLPAAACATGQLITLLVAGFRVCTPSELDHTPKEHLELGGCTLCCIGRCKHYTTEGIRWLASSRPGAWSCASGPRRRWASPGGSAGRRGPP